MKRDWTLAIGYMVLVYATLEIARVPTQFLRAHGWLRNFLALVFSLCGAGLISILIMRHRRSAWRYMALFSIGIVYFFAARTAVTPEEKIHFIEYGLAGIFFLRALRHHIKKFPLLWFSAFILASFAGWVDELLQGFTPHRHYDFHDVLINATSVGLGLLVALILRPSNSPR